MTLAEAPQTHLFPAVQKAAAFAWLRAAGAVSTVAWERQLLAVPLQLLLVHAQRCCLSQAAYA